ncbi:hypothetical protein [Sabulicella glaciei]|uniref:Uncharacterized protein n=1 Tax=Sabulicella glaciei TaxID=2984948 RepID=A0ABT3P3H0_9PROT|nr:hypothetical protein [Roseococcus sp. MDT2-1-1]MCW8088329.1 hypothetical protein [Roseococcus sp. MDT2-1-1]
MPQFRRFLAAVEQLGDAMLDEQNVLRKCGKTSAEFRQAAQRTAHLIEQIKVGGCVIPASVERNEGPSRNVGKAERRAIVEV